MLPYASSSSTTISQGYDVFMSFRGMILLWVFTSHLYQALTQNIIKTYKDDKTLKIGNPIASELLQTIETSRIAIVVLSSNIKMVFGEIAKIVDCMRRHKLIVIPIFYHVSPSDVRHQKTALNKDLPIMKSILKLHYKRWKHGELLLEKWDLSQDYMCPNTGRKNTSVANKKMESIKENPIMVGEDENAKMLDAKNITKQKKKCNKRIEE